MDKNEDEVEHDSDFDPEKMEDFDEEVGIDEEDEDADDESHVDGWDDDENVVKRPSRKSREELQDDNDSSEKEE